MAPRQRKKPIGLPLADLLYLRRKQLGLTQERLATRLQQEAEKSGQWSGATAQLIHRYEMGTTPRSDSLAWLAAVLQISSERITEQARQQQVLLESVNSAPADERPPILAVIDSGVGGSGVERREFAKLSLAGVLGVTPYLDLERLQAVAIGAQLDEHSLTQLTVITEELMRKSWSINPGTLFPIVRDYFGSFGNVLLGVPSKLSSQAYSMAGEVAFLTGYLSLKSGEKAEASLYWRASERLAESAGDNRLRAVLLAIQSWQAQDEGQWSEALKRSEQAQHFLGTNPEPVVAALTYANRACDFAGSGRSQEASRDIERAEHYLGQLSGSENGLYVVENVRDEVDFARGWQLFNSKQYAQSASTFEQTLAHIDPTWKAQQSVILAHLGSVYAQQGEIEQAAHTFRSALHTAREAAAFRYVERTKIMRQQWLGNIDSPIVRRLDEEFATN